jgi:hypothetical protein
VDGLSGWTRDRDHDQPDSADEKKADRIEGEISYDFKVIGSDLGYFFPSAVST